MDRQKENENKKFLQLENDRKTKELEEARQLQLSMLPKTLPQLPHLDIAVYMKTATEVGGDYYDFNVGMDGTLTVVIGDATGHGMMSRHNGYNQLSHCLIVMLLILIYFLLSGK